MSGAESSFSTLVIWGSTGKRVQFTRQDLRMPEDLKERQNYHFFEKQWDAVAGFWMNRVLKEPVLQYATVSEIIECIVNDIERRWDQRKREKALYKKRKRLLDPRGTAAHGVPSPHVLLTNFVSLSEYRRLSAAGELPDLITAVTKKVEEVAKVKVLQHQLLVDEGNDVGNESSGVGDAEVPEKRRRLEDGAEDEATSQKEEAKEQPTSEPSFDDHVALVCTLPNVEKAATAVAELHGSVFDSRATSHPSNNGAGNLLSVGTVVGSGSARNTSRSLTTGDGYSYRPGRIARLLRRFFVFLVPRSVHKRLVASMKSGMERVRELEQQQQWLSKHGSPLQVLGLPEHAELKEVRTRYRDMVLETHPDTALVSSVQRQQHYETIQAAYQMATTPSSLWHQNGSAPALYRHLVGGSAVRMRSTALFAAFSYIVMILLVLCFSLVFVKQGLELALRALDPTFYAFMLAQEDKEQLDRLAGEPVSTDPKRLAPTVMKRLLFPGRFLHFSEPEHTHTKQ